VRTDFQIYLEDGFAQLYYCNVLAQTQLSARAEDCIDGLIRLSLHLDTQPTTRREEVCILSEDIGPTRNGIVATGDPRSIWKVNAFDRFTAAWRKLAFQAEQRWIEAKPSPPPPKDRIEIFSDGTLRSM